MMPSQPIEVESIAKDIAEYFSVNPNAGDTVEGIANWWIANQRFKNSTLLVQKALEHLVQQGVLHKKVFDGREIYVRDAVTKRNCFSNLN